jgi:hypothetical protein
MFGSAGEVPLHRTAIVTVLEVTPPTEITTGIADPVATPAGTCTLTWYSPTAPGASPANSTGASIPPIVTVGVVVVDEIIVLEAGVPLGGGLVTAPSPVQ